MTTIRKYQCNLCHSGSIAKVSLYGLHFTGTDIQFHHESKCENHICRDCLKAILASGPTAIRSGEGRV